MLGGDLEVPSTARRWWWASIVILGSLAFKPSSGSEPAPAPRPHIVIILADDMGWNDVGFHGSDQIPTPNIDALAYNGLILNQHYTLPLCTPSRAALLTGKFPIRTGMQHLVILEDEPWGLGLEERLLSDHLREAGYRTHAVGKWHLGFFQKEYTPTYRGFDSFFGYWQGYKDYYNHTVKPQTKPMDGYDMHRNMKTAWDADGKYSTDLFTDEAVKIINDHPQEEPLFLYLSHLAPHTGNARDPFQAPDDTVAKFTHISDLQRRVYAAMVSKLDDSVGDVVAALKARNMLDNSVIVFLSDNGGQTYGVHANRASNFPLRGMKTYAWEGGTRGVAAVWSPLLSRQQAVSNQMMHLVDWVPTLCSLAGCNKKKLENIDGLDLWNHLSEGLPSARTEFVYNIDHVQFDYAAVRKDNWKYVEGTALAEFNGWTGDSGKNSSIIYSPRDVIHSKVGVSISGYQIRNALLENIKYHTTSELTPVMNEKVNVTLLTEESVLRLRREAEVLCPQSENFTKECRPLEEACLFDLITDPCEVVNLAPLFPGVTVELRQLLDKYRAMTAEPSNKPGEADSNPALWNNTYVCWHDELKKKHLIVLDFTMIALMVCSVVLIAILAAIVVATVPRIFGATNKVSFDQNDIKVKTKSMEKKFDHRF